MSETEGMRVLTAMSGGVDSSVAVRLLQDRGYRVSGATMRLLDGDEDRIDATRRIAEQLGIEFFVFDFREEFRREVMDSFAETYIAGRTPNPCVVCNRKLKFGKFLEKAEELGFDRIATGHYAAVEQGEDGRFCLKKSRMPEKDQSYFLFGLSREVLRKVIFPLEEESKEHVRQLAETMGLDNARSKDSQDICFVPDGDYMKVIDGYYRAMGRTRPGGTFVSVDGRFLAKNPGIERYTVGQRKGVGVALGGEEPLYVVGKDPVKRTVIMGENRLLFSEEMTVQRPLFPRLTKEEAAAGLPALTVKTRSQQKPVGASVDYDPEEDCLRVRFDFPLRAVTPGQYAVFYHGDEVICGGEIL